MSFSYMGQILMVDLTTGEINPEKVPDEIYEKYIGGTGLGAYILYNRVPADADPLGPENIFGVVSGLLTGTGSLFTGRWMVVGKSPLTGGYGDANCGGNFSPAIKRCGYDGIFFIGISPEPVYLHIGHNSAELKDASDLWGLDTVTAEDTLIERYKEPGTTPRVACIGPAGEKLSRIAGVSNDHGRIAARSGLGAVMGSKKLKALVLTGKKRIPVYDSKEMKRLSKSCNKWVQFQPPLMKGSQTAPLGNLMGIMPTQLIQDGMLYKTLLRKWGTVSMNQISMGMGDSPIKNWAGTTKDWPASKSDSVNPGVFTDCEIIKYHCYSCPLGCGGICTISEKYGSDFSETHKPEYETVVCLGALCMNEDKDSIFYMNELLNRAGMDTISAGHAMAFAIECYVKGIISKEDTGGLELAWGNSEAMIALLHKIIDREGIGDILADGVKVAAEKIGQGSEEFAVHAGGQEPAAHDGRADPGFALHYCVEPTPGRHTIGSQMYYEMYQLWKKIDDLPKAPLLYHKDSKYVADEEKAMIGAACSKYMNLINGVGECLFGALMGATRVPIFEWLNAATGWDKTPKEYMEIGKNIQTLKQAFNLKHGITPKRTMITKRALGYPAQTQGVNKNRSLDIDKMAQDYWRQFGWDEDTGKPSEETLKAIGINGEEK